MADAGSAAATDELLAQAEQWGVVGDDGVVRVREGMFAGRAVGRVQWYDRGEALTRLALAFRELDEQCQALEREARAAATKAPFLGRVRRLLDRAGTVKALGDFDRLVMGLRALEREILDQIEERTRRKEELAARAEALAGSTEWKATGDAFEALLTEWKAVGGVGEAEEGLWERFRSAREAFRKRRAEHFAERDRARRASRERKEALIARAEELSGSSEWKETTAALRELQAEWKQAGFAGDQDGALWSRFRRALDTFFERRAASYEESRHRKEELVARAEALIAATDWTAATEEMQDVQTRWREAGFAGPEHDRALWARFRAAQDAFFARRQAAVAERARAARENFGRKQELCDRAEALAYAADTQAAREEAERLRERWQAFGDGPGELERRFRRAVDTVIARAREDELVSEREWKIKTRQALQRKRDEVAQLRAAIARDEASIADWQAALDAGESGASPDERAGLEDRIAKARERIETAQASVEELEASIRGVEAMLR